jgi:pimeloyl-ACP methyl ester carboxylesterase
VVDADIQLPAAYDGKVRLLESFSPKTCNDHSAIAEWSNMFTIWPMRHTAGLRRQFHIAPQSNRLPAYRAITAPVPVIGFADDVVVSPAEEVADALSNGRYLQIADAGNLGFLERPDAVNATVLQFFADGVS